MTKKIKVYIILTIIIGVLLVGFLMLGSYQKTEQKYQACLEKCEADYCGFGSILSQRNKEKTCQGCKAECREEYAK